MYPLRCSPKLSLKQRLDHRSMSDPKTGCVLWTASRSTNGYGHLRWSGRLWQAHRVAWMAKYGSIPAGLYVCHRCDVRTCINPEHLFVGTQKDNMADKAAKAGHERHTETGPERRPKFCASSSAARKSSAESCVFSRAALGKIVHLPHLGAKHKRRPRHIDDTKPIYKPLHAAARLDGR